MSDPLWRPSETRVRTCTLTAFKHRLEERLGKRLDDYKALHDYSIQQPEEFWLAVATFCDVRAESWGEQVLVDGDKVPGARFFPDARLNFAENLLRRRDDATAIVFRAEDQVRRSMTWAELYDGVSRLAAALRAAGVEPGDRCAGFVPNMPEAIMAMLATAAIGATWTSCSPDFGKQGVLDRFGQTEPKILFSTDGYFYNGKRHDSRARVADFISDLPSVEQVVFLQMLQQRAAGAVHDAFGRARGAGRIHDVERMIERHVGEVDLAGRVAGYECRQRRRLRHGSDVGLFVQQRQEHHLLDARQVADEVGHPAGKIDFAYMPFNHPLYIMYSSGTTGAPKCIVHGAGGTLLQHLKEHQLHTDVRRNDRLFYFTTCGWMMWNWLVSGLASEATVMLYDGSPFYPDGNILFDFAAEDGITHFGTSAKYIDALAKAGINPIRTHDLKAMRVMTSTGSPLAPEGFDYVYTRIKKDLQLSSISGGTDIVSCFMLGCPVLPVWRGEIQASGLGMAVEVFNEDGKPVTGEKGELVCTRPFPSMPVGFWNDPDGSRYKSAYFERFENVWCHGDFVERTAHDGLIIYGRSDATLNPGGVRIGTAEIYRQVEQFDSVMESIVIGQEWDNDTRVVLFVVLKDGVTLDETLEKEIKTRIKQNCTPRHVPAKIVQVDDIPRTKSGKITELAVRDIVHGRMVKNREALANPEALEYFADIEALKET